MSSGLSRRIRPSAVAGLALSLLVHGAIAGPKASPFQAVMSIKEAVSFTYAAPCFAIGALSGQGFAYPVGRISGSSQDCINPAGVFNPNAPSYQFASIGPGLVFEVSSTDRILAAYSGTLTYKVNSPHVVSGNFVITGGTGRFAGATGGGTLSGLEDISGVVTGTGFVTFSGTILYNCQGNGNTCAPMSIGAD